MYANWQPVNCQLLYTNVTRTTSRTFVFLDNLIDSDCDPPNPGQLNCLSSISSPVAVSLSTVRPLGATRTSLTQFRCQITVVESNRQTSRVCGCVTDPSKHSFVCVRPLQGSVCSWHNKGNLCLSSSPKPGPTRGCQRSPGHSEPTWDRTSRSWASNMHTDNTFRMHSHFREWSLAFTFLKLRCCANIFGLKTS